MILDENYSYSIKEASEITKVAGRTLTRLAVKLNKKKIDGRYILEGFELIKYLKYKKIDVVKHDDVLKENIQLKTKNSQLAKVVEELTKNVFFLDTKNAELKNQQDLEIEALREENKNLIAELKEDIPHHHKLQKAIELITLEAMRQNVTHKVFTDSEYNELIGTISSVDFHTKQVEYLKTRIEKQDAVLNEMATNIKQRTFIEAKDKGYDKK
jgi:hypothetical protein